jgi:hypothetical protein
MDPCWQNTPKELTIYILKLACSRLVYRDGKYIDIGTLDYKLIDCKSINCINEYLDQRLELNQSMESNIEDDGWYLQFHFNKKLTDSDGDSVPHGLCFDYKYCYGNTYEICYWSFRIPEPGSGPWTQIRTIMN